MNIVNFFQVWKMIKMENHQHLKDYCETKTSVQHLEYEIMHEQQWP